MSELPALIKITKLPPDQTKWRQQGRGFVDWKFSQLCEYLGYHGALDYVRTVTHWHDYHTNYYNCLLITSFAAFRTALGEYVESQINKPA